MAGGESFDQQQRGTDINGVGQVELGGTELLKGLVAAPSVVRDDDIELPKGLLSGADHFRRRVRVGDETAGDSGPDGNSTAGAGHQGYSAGQRLR